MKITALQGRLRRTSQLSLSAGVNLDRTVFLISFRMDERTENKFALMERVPTGRGIGGEEDDRK